MILNMNLRGWILQPMFLCWYSHSANILLKSRIMYSEVNLHTWTYISHHYNSYESVTDRYYIALYIFFNLCFIFSLLYMSVIKRCQWRQPLSAYSFYNYIEFSLYYLCASSYQYFLYFMTIFRIHLS